MQNTLELLRNLDAEDGARKQAIDILEQINRDWSKIDSTNPEDLKKLVGAQPPAIQVFCPDPSLIRLTSLHDNRALEIRCTGDEPVHYVRSTGSTGSETGRGSALPAATIWASLFRWVSTGVAG